MVEKIEEEPIKYHCNIMGCGSDNVRADAYAVWSVPEQKWELLQIFDATICDDCGNEGKLWTLKR